MSVSNSKHYDRISGGSLSGEEFHQIVNCHIFSRKVFPLSVPYKIIQRRTLPKQVIEIHTLEEIQEGLLNGRISKHDGLLHPDITEMRLLK